MCITRPREPPFHVLIHSYKSPLTSFQERSSIQQLTETNSPINISHPISRQTSNKDITYHFRLL